jgi:16S rRNA (adenine1518-N6/adenine1519-N6)-dimethyltransferase
MSSLPIPSRKFLEELGVRPSKGRGQNFVKEAWVVERMAAELAVGDDDLVVEVGPGLGALTGALLATGADVTAIEIDQQLAAYLQCELGSNRFTLVQADARTVSIDQIAPAGRNYDLAANLPYSSAPVILRHFLESDRPPQRAICMLQREVALRMGAEPPDLSLLGVAVQVYADVRLLFDVPPEAFVPKPKVVSSVILLEIRSTPAIEPGERESFFRLVTAGFAQKRKTVLNSLAAALPADRTAMRATLEDIGIDPMRRAETLSVDDWVRLLHALPVT